MQKVNLMTHVVAGSPNMAACEKIVLSMAEAGVCYIEIQIPFSDPIADGPIILHANRQAISQGVTPLDSFALIKRLKQKIAMPILIMTYFNIPFRYGLEKFCKKAHEVGVYGLIIPDIPVDEEAHEQYLSLCRKYDLHAIQVISPITPKKRLRKLAKVASGFVYCVSMFGITGHALHSHSFSYLEKVRKYIKLPLALGFGISSKRQVKAALRYADIAVIGSKIIELCSTSKGNAPMVVRKFLKAILNH